MRLFHTFGRAGDTRTNLLLGALLVAPMIAAIAVYIVQRQPLIGTDSLEYLRWDPIRTSVYPLFLKIVRGPFILPVQLLMFALSVSWLVRYVYRLYRNILLVALLCAAILGNAYLWKLQVSVGSEAITTPLLVIFLGLIAGYLAKKRLSAALVASVIAGVLAAARPSNFPLLVVPAIVVFLASGSHVHRKLKIACLCFAISLTPVIADKLVTRAVHASETTTLLGRHTFAKAALIDAPPLPVQSNPVDRRLAELAERDFQPIRSVLHSLSDQPRILNIVSLGYETCVERACTDTALPGWSISPAKLDQARFRVGLARLKENPSGYLALTLREYETIWSLNPRKDPAVAKDLNGYLSRASPLPDQQLIAAGWFDPVGPGEYSRSAGLLRSLFILLGIFTGLLTILLGALQFRRGVHPLLTVSFVNLLSVQLVLVFCCFVGIGIPRYTMGMWPMLAAALAFLAAALIDYGRARLNPKPAKCPD
jgi:hypothetical protein